MCKVLSVSRSQYYKWQKQVPGKWKRENLILIEKIKEIHALSRRAYGSPRVAKDLHKEGFEVSRPRVARLMRKYGIRSKLTKKFKVTTNSNHNFSIAENLLDRNFQVGSIGKVWVSDITYIHTKVGWSYLTTVIDLGDRKVIGWHVSSSLGAAQTTVPALKNAMKNRPITQPLIFHSDRGVQYACTEFRKLLQSNKYITQSMSRKGNCWDNAVAESFFKTLKHEWANDFKYNDKHHVDLSMFEYIESFYNTKRLHSALGFLSPAEYTKKILLTRMAA